MRTDDDAPAAAAGAMTAPGDDAKRAERRTSVTFASADVIVEGSDAGGGGGGGDARRPPAGSRRVSVGSGAAASARVSALRDGSFAASDFVNTNRIVLRSDGRGNAYLNQYVVIKDLGQGAFGKVRGAEFRTKNSSSERRRTMNDALRDPLDGRALSPRALALSLARSLSSSTDQSRVRDTDTCTPSANHIALASGEAVPQHEDEPNVRVEVHQPQASAA